MPKAERRTSGARAAPYPAIRPGDKPRSTSSTSSTTKPTSKPSPAKPATKAAAKSKSTAANPATKKALADKPSTSVNIPPKTKPATKSKKAVPTPVEKPSEEDIAPNDTAEEQSPSTKPTPKKKATPKKPSPNKSDDDSINKGSAATFLELTLPGEPTSSVPMHDTCSTIRHKINDLLGKDNKKPENGNPAEKKKGGTLKPFTKASFVRAIGCTPKTLDTFLGAKKMMGGAESPVYPAAYIFFEKKRIWEGRKKTAGRLKVEQDRPNGLPLRDPNLMRIWVKAGENPADFLDEYGQ